MPDMLTVIHVGDTRVDGRVSFGPSWDAEATLRGVLRAAFGDDSFKDARRLERDGVSFKEVREAGSWFRHGRRLSGVEMVAGPWGNLFRRRATIDKHGNLNLDALRSRFVECRRHAEDCVKREKASGDYKAAAKECRARVMARAGYPEDDWRMPLPARISVHSPEKVILDTDVNGAQLLNIESFLGRPVDVHISLGLTEDEAVEVYTVLKVSKTSSKDV